MRIVALIDEADVIARILCHLGLWEAGVGVEPARDQTEPAESMIELWLDDPFPDHDKDNFRSRDLLSKLFNSRFDTREWIRFRQNLCIACTEVLGVDSPK